MHMPGLDRTRMNSRKIDLAETHEMWRVLPQHMHDLAAVIDNLTQWDYLHSRNHKAGSSVIYSLICRRETSIGAMPSYTARYQSMVAETARTKSQRASQPSRRLALSLDKESNVASCGALASGP